MDEKLEVIVFLAGLLLLEQWLIELLNWANELVGINCAPAEILPYT